MSTLDPEITSIREIDLDIDVRLREEKFRKRLESLNLK